MTNTPVVELPPCDPDIEDCSSYLDDYTSLLDTIFRQLIGSATLPELFYLTKTMALLAFGVRLFQHYPNRVGMDMLAGPYRWWIYACYTILFSNFQLLLTQILWSTSKSPSTFGIFFKFSSITTVIPTVVLPVLIYLIEHSYDTMNFNLDDDPNYASDFPMLQYFTGVDFLIDLMTHRSFLAKHWKLNFIKVALCVQNGVVQECSEEDDADSVEFGPLDTGSNDQEGFGDDSGSGDGSGTDQNGGGGDGSQGGSDSDSGSGSGSGDGSDSGSNSGDGANGDGSTSDQNQNDSGSGSDSTNGGDSGSNSGDNQAGGDGSNDQNGDGSNNSGDNNGGDNSGDNSGGNNSGDNNNGGNNSGDSGDNNGGGGGSGDDGSNSGSTNDNGDNSGEDGNNERDPTTIVENCVYDEQLDTIICSAEIRENHDHAGPDHINDPSTSR